MAKVRTIQSVLNGGELAPRLKGRTEIPRYKNGLETCRNALPLVMGGATRRSGTRHKGLASGATVMLAGVVLSTTERYVLEFGNQTVRFWKNGVQLLTGGNPYALATPYSAADLAELTVEQTTDEVYLFHSSHVPRKLTRSGDTWTITTVTFKGGPFLKQPDGQAITLTPSADSGNITVTASADLFVAGDVGSLLRLNYPMDTWGYAAITGFTSATQISATVVKALGENYVSNPAFSEGLLGWNDTSTGTAHAEWDSVNQQCKLIATAAGAKARIEYETTVNNARSYTISVNVVQAPVIVQVGRADNKALYYNQTVTANGVHTGTLALDAAQPGRIYICLETDYAAADPGPPPVAEVNLGIVDDVTLKGSTQLQTASFQFGAFSPKNGYPRTGVFSEQRLFLAGSLGAPTAVWGSKIREQAGDLENFELSTEANAAVAFTPAAMTTMIKHLVAADSIFAFGFDRIVTLSGGDQAISATNIDIKKRAQYTSSQRVRPLQIGNQFHFVTATGKRFRSLRYSLEESAYNAPDLALYSEHLIQEGGGIVGLAYTKEPDPVVWCITAAGTLLSLTLDADQQVAAWARHDSAGVYLSATVIPDENGEDQLWLAVQRYVNGAWRTSIEVMEAGLNTDAAVTGTDAAGKTVWGDLSHLEGEMVDIVADGFVCEPQRVTAGQITLPVAAKAVEIGLHYTATIKDLPVEIGGDGSTVQGANIQVANIRVRFHETKGAMVNGERLPFQQFGPDLMDKPMPAFSGDKEVDRLGRSSDPADSQVEIVQDLPLPLTVLAIIKEVAING